MDVKIGKLIVEEDRPEHIAKHKVKVDEVLEVVYGDYAYIQGKQDRWLLIGKTKKNRFLTIVVGARKDENVYGLITARPSNKEERSFYQEFILNQGGEEYESKTS